MGLIERWKRLFDLEKAVRDLDVAIEALPWWAFSAKVALRKKRKIAWSALIAACQNNSAKAAIERPKLRLL